MWEIDSMVCNTTAVSGSFPKPGDSYKLLLLKRQVAQYYCKMETLRESVVCLQKHAYICACICVCVCLSICLCVYMSVCVHMHVRVHAHVCKYVCTYVCVFFGVLV